MWISAAIESSKAKRRLLRNPQLWLNFDSYFAKDWQAMEILKSLHAAGADLKLLGEFAIWTFHPLANDEAKGKLARGRVMKRGLKKAIAGHESAIEACGLYKYFAWEQSGVMSSSRNLQEPGRAKHVLSCPAARHSCEGAIRRCFQGEATRFELEACVHFLIESLYFAVNGMERQTDFRRDHPSRFCGSRSSGQESAQRFASSP